MSKKRYNLKIRGVANEYIRGRISGIIFGVLRSEDNTRAIRGFEDTVMFTFDATEKQHRDICKLITEAYSNILTIEL